MNQYGRANPAVRSTCVLHLVTNQNSTTIYVNIFVNINLNIRVSCKRNDEQQSSCKKKRRRTDESNETSKTTLLNTETDV